MAAGWRFEVPVRAHQLGPLTPRRLNEFLVVKLRPLRLETTERVCGGMEGQRTFALAHKIEHRVFGRRRPAHAVVVQDQNVELGQRIGGETGRLFFHTHFGIFPCS